jgi:hypothetical protein
MKFIKLPIFEKEFKKYRKKYRSLDQDLEDFEKVLLIFPCGNESAHWNFLSGNEKVHVFKTRLSCAYLKNKSLRLVYAYREKEDLIEFIEIYFKGDKVREDKVRIREYLERLN